MSVFLESEAWSTGGSWGFWSTDGPTGNWNWRGAYQRAGIEGLREVSME